MTWTPTPQAPTRTPRPGWFPETPTPESRTPQPGWFPIYSGGATETGCGIDHPALIIPGSLAQEIGAGHDTAATQLLSIITTEEAGRGIDLGLVSFLTGGIDRGAGTDRAATRPRSSGTDRARGIDYSTTLRAGGTGRETARGTDLPAALRARLPAIREPGRGIDTGTAGFTPQSASQVYQITTTGTHQFLPIPAWCRYIDVILLGAGGGGAGGNQLGADGRGGAAGVYASRRWDRGASRNTWRQLAILLGNGGSGGSRNNNGSGGAGGATELWIDDWSGWVGEYLQGGGGSGGSGTNPVFGNDRPGKSPGNHTFQGITAVGGGGNSSAPGSGGEGGGGSSWPLNSGSGKDGARGQAWIRFSM